MIETSDATDSGVATLRRVPVSVEQIQAAYMAEDGARDQPVYSIEQIPLAYESITVEWLTQALCLEIPGASVTQVKLGAPDSGSANRRKLSLKYNPAGEAAGLPTKLFCKASHELSNRIVLGLTGAAHAECSFYKSIRPLLDIESPIAYYTALDPVSINSLIILNDISDDVQSFCDHHTVITAKRAQSQLSLLASLHAQGYSKPEVRQAIKTLDTWQGFFTASLDFGLRDGSDKGFLDAVEVIPSSTYKRFPEVWDKMAASVEAQRRLPKTIAHGDVHLKNWYIAGNGELGLGDWQCVTRGHWSRDVAYAIATALTVEDRRAWERDLLLYYLDRLHAAGGPRITFDEAWLHYRQQLMTALTWWTITLCPTDNIPDMQPRDITLEMIRRIATAIDDCGSLDSFS